jgi:NAD(P)H-flavin reductase
MHALADTATDHGTGCDVMLPRPFRVVRRRRDTHDTVTLLLEPVDGERMGYDGGQFTMVSAFGVGEVPISISGDPTSTGLLEHTIRDVGGVTHALCAASRGDVLGIRGPYGVGWHVEHARGADVVIVAGGIGLAPLRPALLEVLARRADFGRVVLLYGARTPEDVLFQRELEVWRGRFDLDVEVTVDYGPPGWRGRVGLVTTLIPRAGFDPPRAWAFVCGPEVMMRHVATALADRGVHRDRIRLSMERNMRCGVGLCGHCQLRELFVCVDGPVFSYDRLEPLMSVREV